MIVSYMHDMSTVVYQMKYRQMTDFVPGQIMQDQFVYFLFCIKFCNILKSEVHALNQDYQGMLYHECI